VIIKEIKKVIIKEIKKVIIKEIKKAIIKEITIIIINYIKLIIPSINQNNKIKKDKVIYLFYLCIDLNSRITFKASK